jgi:gas vesicle protein
MSDHYHHDNQGSFLNGLILGAIIGVGVAFFLSTKKGKELANEISEKGLSLLDDVEDTVAEVEEEMQETTSPILPPTISAANEPEEKPASEGNGDGSPYVHIEALQTQGRRLFHGIPKRK